MLKKNGCLKLRAAVVCSRARSCNLRTHACRHTDVRFATDGTGGLVDDGGALANARSWASHDIVYVEPFASNTRGTAEYD